MGNGKWRTIAIIETVIIAVVAVAVIFGIGFMLGRKDTGEANATVASRETEAQQNQETKENATTAENTTTAENRQEETTTATDSEAVSYEVKAENDLKVSFALETSWDSGDKKSFQYKVVIENTGKEEMKDWVIKIPVSEDFELMNYWNVKCELSDGIWYMTPVSEYSNTIAAGTKKEDIGVQVTCKEEPAFSDAVIGLIVQDNSGDDNKDEKKPVSNKEGNAVTEYAGKLHVEGTNLVDSKGNHVVLKGVSTHGIGWYPEYVNKDAFSDLRDMGANVIRLAMYTGESGGYCTGGNKEELKKLIDNGVSYATDLSMYVIIDWHILSDNNPNTYKGEAITFFDEMSKKYADNDHVLYEICNEPNGGTSWEDVKSYAEEVIKVIRKNDKDSVILVGTPTWSQDVDKAAANPIKEDNIMYVLHFYAATHKDDLRNKMTKAIDGGLPVFISEFSICDASGNGGLDYDSANKWLETIRKYEISYVGWNLSNKNESSAILKSSCQKKSGFTKDDMNDSGKWLIESFQ